MLIFQVWVLSKCPEVKTLGYMCSFFVTSDVVANGHQLLFLILLLCLLSSAIFAQNIFNGDILKIQVTGLKDCQMTLCV